MCNILICDHFIRLYNRKGISIRRSMKVDLKKAYNIARWDLFRISHNFCVENHGMSYDS